MKIYIAAPHSQKESAWRIAYELQRAGHSIVSTWFEEDNVGYERDMTPQARIDYDQIKECDLLVVYNRDGESSRGGYHTELGMAIGLEKYIVLIGPQTNVFHWLSGIHRVPMSEGLTQNVLRALVSKIRQIERAIGQRTESLEDLDKHLAQGEKDVRGFLQDEESPL